MIKDLLVEIGTEELPPLALRDLVGAFALAFSEQLHDHGVGHDGLQQYCTPRRLALLVGDVQDRQSARTLCRRGPAVAGAFGPDGSPTKAAAGFARSCGVDVAELERERTEKGEWLVHRTVETGGLTSQLLPQMIERSLRGLPIPRPMRWGSGDAEFVRPIHWICVVFGDEAVSGEVLGVKFGTETKGHRFHAPGPIRVRHASLYPTLLRQAGFVEPSFDERRASILEQVDALASQCGLRAEPAPALLDEVAGLVEWPKALLASFDREFLSVPPEVLIETMQKNQKYFPLRDDNGTLSPSFVVIANIVSKSPEQVRRGNERVIRPRFADAKFFWEQDLTRPLGDNFPRLKDVVFQERLGSIADKVGRVSRLAKEIAGRLGEPAGLVERAALLSKCDLVSTMVGEFPRLQGIMGRYYAELAGEDEAVCSAIQDHYLPRFSGDSLPTSGCSLALALADRLDTLVGIFGIGEKPTGTKDPYGLRRAAIAALRILVETPLELDLQSLLQCAEGGFDDAVIATGTADAVLKYTFDRLTAYYSEQGIAADVVEAVRAVNETVISRFDRRVRAVQKFRNLPAGHSLVAANKRIHNILSKGQGAVDGQIKVDEIRFVEEAEKVLGQRVLTLDETIRPLIAGDDFGTTLDQLAELGEDVDRFFEQVMVMTDDVALRNNRLQLLRHLQGLFLQVADISALQ